MNKQNIAEKQPLLPLTLMGKGSYAPSAKQSYNAVTGFYNSAFPKHVKEIPLATNCLQ